MSRFADPSATAVLPVGACQCPGTPHFGDSATIRFQLGASALARIGRAEIEGAVRLDPFAAYRQTVIETVVDWTFRGEAGPVAITPATIAELDTDTLKALAEGADALIASGGQLPNASGAPSADSSRGSASPTRKRTRTPTT